MFITSLFTFDVHTYPEIPSCIKLAIEEENGAHYIQNDNIKYDCNLDKVTKETFKDIDEDTLIFYTTETMEDILRSYEKHLEIDLMQVSKHVLKKKK